MSKQYVVTRSFYEGNGLHEEGQAFSHEDQSYVEKLLADGNIAEATAEGGSESTTPLAEGAPASDSPNPEAPQAVSPQTPQEPVQTQPETPVQPEQSPSQPTQSEIEATLAASEGGSAPSSNVEIS